MDGKINGCVIIITIVYQISSIKALSQIFSCILKTNFRLYIFTFQNFPNFLFDLSHIRNRENVNSYFQSVFLNYMWIVILIVLKRICNAIKIRVLFRKGWLTFKTKWKWTFTKRMDLAKQGCRLK